MFINYLNEQKNKIKEKNKIIKSKIIIFKVNEKENMVLLIINLKIKKRLIEKYFNLLNKKK